MFKTGGRDIVLPLHTQLFLLLAFFLTDFLATCYTKPAGLFQRFGLAWKGWFAESRGLVGCRRGRSVLCVPGERPSQRVTRPRAPGKLCRALGTREQ